ncbi:hypothetical protein LWI28_000712 [Acer negundo]|uniref:Uncharacterized protein n=1 Tax=Acer negundo TaxID=4023 RepID=A0AAD5I844_ACENE|nr:hypothetical protein LWI28_000712 [Acer negundo]
MDLKFTVVWCKDFWSSFNKSNVLIPSSPSSPVLLPSSWSPVPLPSSWSPPNFGLLKINCRAISDMRNRKIWFGIVIRNHIGIPLLTCSLFLNSGIEFLTANSIAIFKGLTGTIFSSVKADTLFYVVMDEEVVSGSNLVVCGDNKSDDHSLYPMYFGVSCALFALRVLSSKPENNDQDHNKWCELLDKMLQGSAQLLGLLVWTVQRGVGADGDRFKLSNKLETAEREVEELKKLRSEDARANEKVVSIFASQEQIWFSERKKLRQHIGGLMNELQVVEKKKDEAVFDLNEKLKEMEQKRKELEEKLKEAENVREELREIAKKEAQEHYNELWKHKTAFIEMVSNQRQVEAEMGRALRQIDATKQELNSVLDQKEEAVLLAEKLSIEMVKMRKDMDQKDKILSAMLRKSKLDTTEKQILLKEVKLSKAKRKQAELETERWKAAMESRHERHSLRSMFSSNQARGTSQIAKTRSQQPTSYVLESEDPELKSDLDGSDYYSAEGNEDLVDVKRLESWVRLEAEKYATVMEQRHHLELEAFAEQMRLKDEKLESYRWRLMSMELESKRFQSHIEGLNKDMSQLRHDNIQLEALLLEREQDLKQHFASQLMPFSCQKTQYLNTSLHDPALTQESVWSKFKIVKRRPMEVDHEMKTSSADISIEIKEDTLSHDELKNENCIVQSPENNLEEKRDVAVQTPIQGESMSTEEVDTIETLAPSSQASMKMNNSPWRMDIHALGVSYKIKRLKQQLLMLERLTGKIGISPLQAKTDDLCKQMHETDLDMSQGDSNTVRKKGDTKTLEHFLEKTFQLQRYIVVTGQKLMEIQSRITSGFVGVTEELDNKSVSFDEQRFADSVKTLFQEVQRGIEVRIARIIGDLEGTLACEGMIRLRR